MWIDYMSFLYTHLVLPKNTEIKEEVSCVKFWAWDLLLYSDFECAVKHVRLLGGRGGKLRITKNVLSSVISLSVALYYSLLL